ncbi:cyclic lactone autoinducer peptide [Anaerovirgula multivorans]|uniref:Cyclic lactone autoinducer peptide n=1 Tax=Anaerovirgula multivorans TaxID=312168 RepID=A0A239KUT2_9FIRM|nr:cyclic lactone autoinducer peptide [Anaerovirgula multivorans]SNT21971.1 cyclic lactone autoinducer peptide [Anaerovirgula multivorans]
MFKKLKTSVLSVAACLLTIVAMSGVSPASMWYIYEPDIPKSIKKEL